jgi:hypothetical protein
MALDPPQRLLTRPDLRARLVVVLAVLMAYTGSFAAPFLFDDYGSVIDNPTLHPLWPPWTIFSPLRNGTTVTGRPLDNASFALNYAVGGEAPFGYHVVNLLIHVANALLLFALVRRTLELPALGRRLNRAALPLAACIAGLWGVHPLTTEAVTYISQRAEELMASFYLLTLVAFLRAATEGGRAWLALAVTACLAGMETKEVMMTAPLMVLLYDRTFLAGSFAAALRSRPRFYAALAATWAMLAFEMTQVGDRGGSIGLGGRIPFGAGLSTQAWAVARYLRLCLWPHPLTFDYGQTLVTSPWRVIPAGLVLLVALSATAWALVRHPRWGFLGAWFFLILAPTSSFIPVVQQTVAEHRVYLPLAGVVTGVVLLLFSALRQNTVLAVTVLALLACVLTMERNRDYANPLVLWGDSVARFPDNARGWNNLGIARIQTGDLDGAVHDFERALACNPRLAEAYNNRGAVEATQGHIAEAMADYLAALRANPDFGRSRRNLDELRAAHPGVQPAAAIEVPEKLRE